MRVRVFRNLTSACYSVQAHIPGKGWRTVAHASAVSVCRATLDVSEAGRQRVLATGRKVVHAWVEGDLEAWSGCLRPAVKLCNDVGAELAECHLSRLLPPQTSAYETVGYNPRHVSTFVRMDDPDAPVRSAGIVYMGAKVKAFLPSSLRSLARFHA